MRFQEQERRVTQEAAWAYARATNDLNPRYERGEIVPPMFAVVLEMPVLMEALKRPEVIGDPARFLRLLHGEHAMQFFAPIKPGETYATSAELTGKTQKASGEVIAITLRTEQHGRPIATSVASLFIRNETQSGTKEAAREEAARDVVLQSDEHVAMDQSLRYADASGDHNPIHEDPEVAKQAGLPGIILHGLCTMAFAQKHLVNGLAGGQPERLRALRLRFVRPVFPGQLLTISAWPTEAHHYGVEVRAAGKLAAKDGSAEIRP
jgi:acyl dehydratase